MAYSFKSRSIWKRYSFLWVTGALFIFSLIGHWYFAWLAFVEEQIAHTQPIIVSEYFIQVLRDTLENWQSEFLQLAWQVAGLAFLFHVGSPQSKEGDDRTEEKIDALIRGVYGEEQGNSLINEYDRRYLRQE